MAGESVAALLNSLTAKSAESAEQTYAQWAALTIPGNGQSLEELVRSKLVLGGKSAQLRESLLATIRAGGGVGESLEAMLRNTGLTGWS